MCLFPPSMPPSLLPPFLCPSLSPSSILHPCPLPTFLPPLSGLQASESLGTRSVFSYPKSTTGKAAWGAELDPKSVLSAGSVTLAVTPPADAPVGLYSLFVKTKEGESNGTNVGSLLMLFNPWCKGKPARKHSRQSRIRFEHLLRP